MAESREVQYLVLPDVANPYFLARVRWPDICQAISPVRPYWQDDPGLFDLPYDPNSMPVTFDQAAAIAADWDARVPSDATAATPGIPMMRRMPADWSNLSRAEKRAWSIEFMKTGTYVSTEEPAREPRVTTSRARFGRWRLRRRAPAIEGAVLDLTDAGDDFIDLTTAEDAQPTVEPA